MAARRRAGFFTHTGPGLEQRTPGERQRLLRSAHDHDPVRGAAHRTYGPEVVGERLAQRRETHGVAVGHLATRQQARTPRDQARPHVGGELVERRLGDAERPEFRAKARPAAQ